MATAQEARNTLKSLNENQRKQFVNRFKQLQDDTKRQVAIDRLVERFGQATTPQPTVSQRPSAEPQVEPLTPKNIIPRTAERIRETFRGAPTALQIGGGIAGAALVPQAPLRAGAAGGIAGRAAGAQLKEEAEVAPFRTLARTTLAPSGLAGLIPRAQIPPERATEFFKAGERAVVPEILGGFIGGKLIGGVFKKLSSGAMRSLVGTRTAERAQERGWRALLKPEFFKGRVPRFIADGMDKFFRKTSNVTGQAIEKLLKQPKFATIRIASTQLKNDLRKNILRQGNIADFGIDVSTAQRKLLKKEIQKVLNLPKGEIDLKTIWNIRRDLDDTIFGRKWGDEARNLLMNMRSTLNAPLLGAGDEMSEAFGRYAFVKKAEGEFGKSFKSIIDETGETFSAKLEKFLSNTLSTSKDETIRLLRKLDNLLGAKDKVIENALDLAASEVLDKGTGFGIGLWQNMITGALGGKKALAELGALAGSRVTKGVTRGLGRLIPTGLTSAQEQERQQ